MGTFLGCLDLTLPVAEIEAPCRGGHHAEYGNECFTGLILDTVTHSESVDIGRDIYYTEMVQH